MKQLDLFRAIVTFFWRDVVGPGAAFWLLLVDPKVASLPAWSLPIVIALLGTPWVARFLGGSGVQVPSSSSPPPDPPSLPPPERTP